MADPHTGSVLSSDAAARVADFARTCKAAARAVSLYPGGHPAITLSLARLEQITARLTESGPCRLQIGPDRLLVGGARVARPDRAISELGELLHRHLIGGLIMSAGADAESWRRLLLLLARTPEDVRADGGIRQLWAAAAGRGIQIEEIDYAEVLRAKQGVAIAVDELMASTLGGRPLDLDESGMRLLLDIVQDPPRLQAMMAQLQAASEAHGVTLQAAAFLTLLRGLTEYLVRHEPERVDTIFGHMGRAAGQLSADGMLALLDKRNRPESMAGGVDVARTVIAHMDDASVATFVAGSVVHERGASERLAQAFQALVPDVDRQRQLLGLAEEHAAASEVGGDGFAELWSRVEGLLASYSDESYVSTAYARELSASRSRPVDVERASDDPPERVSAWLSSVADAALRNLDHQLLRDLLAIERDPLRWRDVADTVAAHAEDLARAGYIEQAWQLAHTLAEEGTLDPSRRPHAAAALARFGNGHVLKGIAAHVRAADDASYARFAALCHAIGLSVVRALAEVLATEGDARSRRRLRDVLVGFGPRGRESVRELMTAADRDIRRTAAYLLREFGGSEGLREFVPLLTDSEPLVQREAVQALATSGSDEAFRMLLQGIASASGRTRETLMNELAGIRDGRAAPLLVYLVRHVDRRKAQRLYLSAIEGLGSVGGPDAVEALRYALHQGTWHAPLRTRRLRTAAARALRRIGTPAAIEVLRQASRSGPRGVRTAARAHLSGLA